MMLKITVKSSGQGLLDITERVQSLIGRGESEEGICSLFLRHTSCSLLIQENADPSARRDLENWLNRLVPENDNLYTHIYEGVDDMPAHIKAALTQSHLVVPFQNKQLLLGSWQGIYLWEHRHGAHQREIIFHCSD